jgi:hypothetical protein
LKALRVFTIILAIALLCLNFYGLTQSLRPENLVPQHLRFKEFDITISPLLFKTNVERQSEETDKQYASRLTHVIASGLAHVHWEKYDPEKFNQRVPIWENYILYLMSIVTNIPEYKRYHYANPYRSIERGIGICGDASMIMSQMLDKNGIENKIVTVPGHVMVEAMIDGKAALYDPDYGVVLNHSADALHTNPNYLNQLYISQGFELADENFLKNSFTQGYRFWDGASHFITKKYYFEKLAYLLKWLIPLILGLFVIWPLFKKRAL